MKRNIYHIIKKLCDEKSITISQLEKDLKFGNSTISTWKISSPSINKLSMVADYFDISVDYLVGRTTTPQTSDDILNDCGIISIQRAIDKVDNKNREKAINLVSTIIENVFSEDVFMEEEK